MPTLAALHRIGSILALFVACVAAQAQAEERAQAPDARQTTCVVEGIMVVGKQKMISKDCFENIGAEPDDFMRVCDAIIRTATAVTEATNVAPPKVAFGNACPAGAVARCKGFLHMPIINHHYKRSAHDLEIARESCLTQGGEWK